MYKIGVPTYVVFRENTNHVHTGYYSHVMPKLYHKGHAQAAANRLNESRDRCLSKPPVLYSFETHPHLKPPYWTQEKIDEMNRIMLLNREEMIAAGPWAVRQVELAFV